MGAALGVVGCLGALFLVRARLGQSILIGGGRSSGRAFPVELPALQLFLVHTATMGSAGTMARAPEI